MHSAEIAEGEEAHAQGNRGRFQSVHVMSESRYIQVIPLFTSEHGAFEYFTSHRSELDALTGDHLVVVMPKVLTERDGRAWDAPDSERFKRLSHSNLPCLWIEDGSGSHEIIPLPSAKEQVSKVFARLTDAAK